ncbi:hypothetical protein AAY473_025135 [Plecturocebus cupreus]
MRSGDRDHPGQHGETPCLLKYKKLAGCGGAGLQSQLLTRMSQGNRLNLGDNLRSGVRDQPGQHCETPVSTKNTKISWVRWHMLVIPVTQVAEARELLEPGRRRLHLAVTQEKPVVLLEPLAQWAGPMLPTGPSPVVGTTILRNFGLPVFPWPIPISPSPLKESGEVKREAEGFEIISKSWQAPGHHLTNTLLKYSNLREVKEEREEKEARDRAFQEASHLHLHPNSFQVVARFLENQSPSSALPRLLHFLPTLGLQAPLAAPVLFSGATEAPVKKHSPGCLPRRRRVLSLLQSPKESWVPTTHSKPDTSPSPSAHPHSGGKPPREDLASPG